MWLANLADLELHTPLARVPDAATATMIAFDLDPGAPATVVECGQVALLLQGMFDGLGLQCFPKTSGSKGMQVYLPLNTPGVTFAQTRAFAKAVAELLAKEVPELVVAQQSKAKREGKVLVDWMQNDASKTTVSVYSLRARRAPDRLDAADLGRGPRRARPWRTSRSRPPTSWPASPSTATSSRRRVACAGASRVVTSGPCGRCASCCPGFGSLRRSASRPAASARWRPSTTASAATRIRSPSPSRPRSRPSAGAWLTARRR